MEDGRGSFDRSGTIHFYDDDEALEKMRLLQDRPGFAAFRTKIGATTQESPLYHLSSLPPL
jgi:hypothetical protein